MHDTMIFFSFARYKYVCSVLKINDFQCPTTTTDFTNEHACPLAYTFSFANRAFRMGKTNVYISQDLANQSIVEIRMVNMHALARRVCVHMR